jgi:hypothetical protein
MPCPPVVSLLTYNYYYLGSIFDFGYGTTVIHPLSSYWGTPFLYGLLGIPISPIRGLLTYSPVLLVSFVGILFMWVNKYDLLLKYLSLGPVLLLILYSKWHFWWGGETYGPRLISDIALFICFYVYPIWESIKKTV